MNKLWKIGVVMVAMIIAIMISQAVVYSAELSGRFSKRQFETITRLERGIIPKLPTSAYVENNVGILELAGSIASFDFYEVSKAIGIFQTLGLKELRIILLNWGGSPLTALAVAGLLENAQQNFTVSIHGYGIVASAATLVLVSGSPGHRYLDQNTLVMFHEIHTFEYISYKSTGDKRKEMERLKMLQNKLTTFICDRTNIAPKTLDDKTFDDEWWIGAEEAIQLGIVDALL